MRKLYVYKEIYTHQRIDENGNEETVREVIMDFDDYLTLVTRASYIDGYSEGYVDASTRGEE